MELKNSKKKLLSPFTEIEILSKIQDCGISREEEALSALKEKDE